MATTKTRTDARRTAKKTQIGVTQARATDSRQTKHKLSFDQNYGRLFDPAELDSEVPGHQNGYKTRWTLGSALKELVGSH